jgi:APA family basic amino acid/polyamine antiporter
VAAHIGKLFPVSGASFIVISHTLSPFYGFIGAWFMLAGANVAVAFLALGFADYAALIYPQLDRTWTASAIVLGLGGLNMLGARSAVLGQGAMVLAFMLALVVFCAAGLVRVDPGLLTPFAPNGLRPVLGAAIPAYFSFTGFMLIIELGGEIRDPSRTIPRSLFISFLIVLLVYAAVSLTLVGVVRWQQFAHITAPVGYVSRLLLPGWAATMISLTAMAAAATSINGVVLTYSRDIQALAACGLLPTALSRVSPSNGDPIRAVVLMTVLSVFIVLARGTIVQYASLLVLAVITLQILLGLGLLRCRKRPALLPPDSRGRARSSGWLVSGLGLVTSSLAFAVIAVLDSLETSAIAGAFLLAGAVYYHLRKRHLAQFGISIESRIAARIASQIKTTHAD